MSSHSCNWFFEFPVKEVVLKDDNKRGRLTEIAEVHAVARLYLHDSEIRSGSGK